ncbi:MAG TPA: HAMP domain-containing sensor histidine kinase [Vicinamibacteria bacterium]|nr:HAMP domain-containing sensor histidine kinase [Vicinamibacteria bacterium]
MKERFDSVDELTFASDYVARTLFGVRVGLVLGLALYSLFAPLDVWMLPESWPEAHFIRFAVVLPVFAITFAATFVEGARRHLQRILTACAIVVGLGIVGMIAVAQEAEPGFRYYYAGLLLVLAWCFTLIRLRFLPTVVCTLSIILGYGVVAVFDQGLLSAGILLGSGPVFLNNSFFLLGGGIITLMGSYILESYARQDFHQRQELSRTLEELEAAQSQLIRAERANAISRVVAGLLHELNTPVGAIASAADVMSRGSRKLRDEPEGSRRAAGAIEEGAAILREAAGRVTHTLDVLKRFSNVDRAESADYDVNKGLEDCVTLLAPELGDRITIERELAEIPKIRCRPAEVNQVFMSLLQNAIESIEETGTVGLRTSEGNEHVSVEVIDTGVGIPEDRLQDLFVPKFGRGGGGSRVKLGLGLVMSHDIVRRHGGTIRVQSRLGEGTCVTVTLPTRKVEG